VAARHVFDAQLRKMICVPIVMRSDMKPGATVSGPAIIAEDNTSTLVTATFDAHLDAGGGLVLTRKRVD